MKITHFPLKKIIVNLILVQLVWMQPSLLFAANQALTKPNTQNSSAFVQPHINQHDSQAIAPKDLQSIQVIGRSVLAAKHEAQPDPDAIQLKLRLQMIHQNLMNLQAEEVHIESNETKAEVNLDSANTVKTQDGQKAAKESTQKSQKRQKLESDLALQTNQLRTQAGTIKAKHTDLKLVGNANEGRRTQINSEQLADKSQALATEVDEALADTSDQRLAKLAKLRDRLQTKSLGDLQPKLEPAPTISTITRHRE